MPAWWRAALDAADVPRRCAKTDAGGAIGRDALDTVPSAAARAAVRAPVRGEPQGWHFESDG
jgi:hypothetical protein